MRPIAVILLLGLVLRLGWGLTRPSDLSGLPDQQEYLAIAENVIQGEGFVFTDPRFGTPAFAHRSPGYPLFVAGLGANVTLVRLAQAMLDTLTVLGAYLLARSWAPGGAVVAAALVAFNPFLIYFSGLILTETLFTCLLTWGAYLLVRPGRPGHPATGWFLLGLVLLVASVTVRPGAVALPTILAVVAAMNRLTLPRLPAGLTAAALTFLLLLPWAWRNHLVLNEWIFTSSNAGLTAYDGFNPAADGSSDQAAFVPHMPELGEMTETQRNHYLLTLASEYRQENPARVVWLSVQKLLRTWSPIPLSEANRSTATVAAGLAFAALLWPLVLVGWFHKRRTGEMDDDILTGGRKFYLLSPAIYLTLTAVASVGSLRYRLPADPMLAVVASAGVGVLLSRKHAANPSTEPVSQTEDSTPVST